MTPRLARPRRPLRNELYALVSVLAFPLALACCFPFDALRFAAEPAPPRTRAACAFVTLTAAEERGILESARRAWAVSTAGVRGIRADLSFAEIPDEEPGAVADIVDRLRYPAPSGVPYDVPALPRTLAAPPPEKIAADPASAEAEEPPFPRAELLKID